MSAANVTPMSVERARCLAMAYELHRLLGELYDRPEGGPGSPAEAAWSALDDVIAHLEPDETDVRRLARYQQSEEGRP